MRSWSRSFISLLARVSNFQTELISELYYIINKKRIRKKYRPTCLIYTDYKLKLQNSTNPSLQLLLDIVSTQGLLFSKPLVVQTPHLTLNLHSMKSALVLFHMVVHHITFLDCQVKLEPSWP